MDGVGMIKSALAIRLAEKKIKITDLARETGIDRTMLTKLYYDRTRRLDLETLNRLCVYFGCNVEGIIRFESDAAEGDGKS
tara:strand:- start:22 stop:264 length:243 start_codon:yes stop_codon:yes gene_type:complete